jgi:hypothetical protein
MFSYADDNLLESSDSNIPSLDNIRCNLKNKSQTSTTTLKDVIQNEDFLIRCLDQYSLNEGTSRRKRKQTANPIKISSYAFTDIPTHYPQLLNSSSEHDSKYIGTYLINPTRASSINDSKQSDFVNNLCQKIPNHFVKLEENAIEECNMLSRIAFYEAKIKESHNTISLWKSRCHDLDRAVHKAQTSLTLLHELEFTQKSDRPVMDNVHDSVITGGLKKEETPQKMSNDETRSIMKSSPVDVSEKSTSRKSKIKADLTPPKPKPVVKQTNRK